MSQVRRIRLVLTHGKVERRTGLYTVHVCNERGRHDFRKQWMLEHAGGVLESPRGRCRFFFDGDDLYEVHILAKEHDTTIIATLNGDDRTTLSVYTTAREC